MPAAATLLAGPLVILGAAAVTVGARDAGFDWAAAAARARARLQAALSS